jgi:putative DNA primase/helicase
MLLPDLRLLRHGIRLFWPDPPDEAWLVLSWVAQGQFCSRWFRMADVSDALTFLLRKARHHDTYVGMALRHPSCTPTGRGSSDDTCALGSLWVELDHNLGQHAATQVLPSPLQLRMFLRSLPFTASLEIDSGGGVHLHYLLKEVWVLDSPTERERAQTLVRRLQRTVQLLALDRGWRVDTTSDLARVLRFPGTFNFKSGSPVPVTISAERPQRWNPGDLESAAWLAPLDAPPRPGPQGPLFPAGDLQRMLGRCAWLQHCYTHAATLDEPSWYASLGLIGRCENGASLAQTWSAPYPRYSAQETAIKLAHALAAAGPRTCHNIRYHLGGEPYCQACPAWGKVKSPIVHSLDDGVRLRMRAAASWRPRFPKGR